MRKSELTKFRLHMAKQIKLIAKEKAYPEDSGLPTFAQKQEEREEIEKEKRHEGKIKLPSHKATKKILALEYRPEDKFVSLLKSNLGSRLKIDETKNEFRIRVRQPKLFIQKTFRIKHLKKGISILIGKLKSKPKGYTKIQSYRFDKAQFLKSEVRAWLIKYKIRKH